MKLRYILIAAFTAITLISCATGNVSNSVSTAGENAESMVNIPRGWFTMGLNTSGMFEGPEHEVYIAAFMMDRYEVSARDFAEFLNERGNPYFSNDQYSTVIDSLSIGGKTAETKQNPGRYSAKEGFENYPANNVSWYGAEAYCKWKGKRLPTEAEWEKAARSDDKRKYPWGNNMPDDKKARYNQKWEEKGLKAMSPVNAHTEGASYYGCLNMAGNVWEWVGDWYKQNYCDYRDPEIDASCSWCNTACVSVTRMVKDCYGCAMNVEGNICPAAERSETNRTSVTIGEMEEREFPSKSNPAGPSTGSFKVLRGGSWYDSFGESAIRTTYRYWFDPMDRYLNTGFRCAK